MIKENVHGRARVVVREALSESLEGVHLEVVRDGVVEVRLGALENSMVDVVAFLGLRELKLPGVDDLRHGS